MWDSKPKKITSATLGLETKIAPTNTEQKLMKIAKCLGRAIDQTTYHGQILLKEQEELMLIEAPVSLHVFWKEEGLLQSLGNMICMPPVVMSNGGIPGNGDIVHFQFRRPYA